MRQMSVEITASFSERRKMTIYVCTSPASVAEVAVKNRATLSNVKLKLLSVKA